MYMYSFTIIQIDHYWQFMDSTLLRMDFWSSLLYFHFNPPGLSLLFYLFDLLSNDHHYLLLQLVLPIMHCWAFYLFYTTISRMAIPYSKIISAVILLNPLWFIYFH